MRSPHSEATRKRVAGALVLPAHGYQGDPPEFTLPNASERELEVWREVWRTPQAAAWAVEGWRHRTVAMWVRWSVRCEDPDSPAALGSVTVRLADQIGLTPAGLTDNGWRVAEPDEPAVRPTAGIRHPRTGFIAQGGDNDDDPSARAQVQPSSLERARRRAADRDPRAALYDGLAPDDAG